MKINLVDDDSNNIENIQRINDNPTKMYGQRNIQLRIK